ncbi:hypothetical protein ACKZDW_23590 [Ralstonia syzygii subsp. celebesensis]|uniref:hypothetical protein n=1 Tax=Ralstonia solanacearum species complex TaxID=3116862 RepID=UPI0001D9691F|nr:MULTISPECIES: hypothetical protein [Ralstonia solanacearum species complex]QQV55153.1 hypothetical protein JK151_13950 [Ralstonia syzygii subsp. celebesensis]CBM10538.1 protein of unknown function [Ralstonia solanacearum PSI07]
MTLAPDNDFQPGMAVSPWVRIQTACTSEPRAIGFPREAGRRTARKRASITPG